jgi:hypothetical protein
MTLFVAKSSRELTWIPRRVTDRLTVRRLVNINPDRPRTSSTAAPRKPHHHLLWSPRSESKSFFFLKRARMASIEPSRKLGREEVSPSPPAEMLTVNFRQPSHEFTFNVGIDLLF